VTSFREVVAAQHSLASTPESAAAVRPTGNARARCQAQVPGQRVQGEGGEEPGGALFLWGEGTRCLAAVLEYGTRSRPVSRCETAGNLVSGSGRYAALPKSSAVAQQQCCSVGGRRARHQAPVPDASGPIQQAAAPAGHRITTGGDAIAALRRPRVSARSLGGFKVAVDRALDVAWRSCRTVPRTCDGRRKATAVKRLAEATDS
jgi:hypothetical protein